MDERGKGKKLLLGLGGIALFVGFIFFTRWTGDEPGSVKSLDDAEKADLASFCYALNSSFADYETAIQVAAGLQSPSGDSNGVIDSYGGRSFLESILSTMADKLPKEWAEDAHKASDGLERAYDGNLRADEVDEYVASFRSLQEKAADDCDEVEGIDFGNSGYFDYEPEYEGEELPSGDQPSTP